MKEGSEANEITGGDLMKEKLRLPILSIKTTGKLKMTCDSSKTGLIILERSFNMLS